MGSCGLAKRSFSLRPETACEFVRGLTQMRDNEDKLVYKMDKSESFTSAENSNDPRCRCQLRRHSLGG